LAKLLTLDFGSRSDSAGDTPDLDRIRLAGDLRSPSTVFATAVEHHDSKFTALNVCVLKYHSSGFSASRKCYSLCAFARIGIEIRRPCSAVLK